MKKITLLLFYIIGMVLLTGCKKDEENSGENFVIYKTIDEVKKSGREFVLQVDADFYSEFRLNGSKIDVSDNIFIAVKKGIKYTFKFKATDVNVIWYRMKYDSYGGYNEMYRNLYLAKCVYTHKITKNNSINREYISEGEGYFTITDNHEVW